VKQCVHRQKRTQTTLVLEIFTANSGCRLDDDHWRRCEPPDGGHLVQSPTDARVMPSRRSRLLKPRDSTGLYHASPDSPGVSGTTMLVPQLTRLHDVCQSDFEVTSPASGCAGATDASYWGCCGLRASVGVLAESGAAICRDLRGYSARSPLNLCGHSPGVAPRTTTVTVRARRTQ